jgi:hypothetical protein
MSLQFKEESVMRVTWWLVRLLIPLAVLYTMGYFVAGYSALTLPWLILLSIIIVVGYWAVVRVLDGNSNRTERIIIGFLVSTVVIFTLTLGIRGGHVPMGQALLAALLISLFQAFIPEASQVR